MTTFATLMPDGTLKDKWEVDINALPSQDPMAFAYGISRGQVYMKANKRPSEVDHGDKHKELAPEYLRGFLFGYHGILVPEGTKIRNGQERTLALMRLNTWNPPQK